MRQIFLLLSRSAFCTALTVWTDFFFFIHLFYIFTHSHTHIHKYMHTHTYINIYVHTHTQTPLIHLEILSNIIYCRWDTMLAKYQFSTISLENKCCFSLSLSLSLSSLNRSQTYLENRTFFSVKHNILLFWIDMVYSETLFPNKNLSSKHFSFLSRLLRREKICLFTNCPSKD